MTNITGLFVIYAYLWCSLYTSRPSFFAYTCMSMIDLESRIMTILDIALFKRVRKIEERRLNLRIKNNQICQK